MSMAEDTRYRSDYSHEPERPDATRREPSPDPLTELARLIGQSDPFGDPRGRRASAHIDAQDASRTAPGWLARTPEAPADEQAGFPSSYAEQGYGTHRAYDEQHDPAHDQYSAQGAYAHDDRYAQGHGHADARYAAQGYADQGYEQPADDRYRVAVPAAEYESEDYYDDGHLPPRGDDDGMLHGRRRGGIITIAAVLGLALIGTAGAFGYRAFTGPSAGSAPPIIKADPTPAKSTPASPSADAADKPFQERVGAPGTVQTERIVPREEAPVSQPVPQVGTAPWPAPPRAGAGAPPAAVATPPAPVPAENTKRVRTETIRMAPAGDTTATTTRPTAATTPPARAAKNAPMTLSPPAEVPNAPTRTATRAAPPAADGAYVVQVSAQKTEGEAQSSYRALQAKYPAVLGGREPSIRRADLGDKGVYYRAQVGPFASASEATSFCDNLKAAGGQCIVQKN